MCNNYRTKKEHILVGGVWCASQKPPAEVFLKPVLKTLRNLEIKGTHITNFIIEQSKSRILHVCNTK